MKVSIPALDPDNDYLDWSLTEAPKCGTVDKPYGTIGAGEEFTYTSDNLLSQTVDTLKITVTDFMADKTIKVVIDISADNDPPYIPTLDTIRVVRGQEFPIDLHGVDPEGLPVTWEVVTSPSNGTLTKVRDTISDSSEATYKSDSSSDSFEYRVSDGKMFSSNKTAYISNYSMKVLQQGMGGYTGCSDVSIGYYIFHKNKGSLLREPFSYEDTTFVSLNSDSLCFLLEC